MPGIVTLTTDFGPGSGYVAEMKGRLLHARDPFTLVDIAHDLPAHDVRAAAWLVGQACPAFPAGTLHIVVVDPGVGTARRLVWAEIGTQQFLCPDNGVLSWILRHAPLTAAREIAVATGAAATFHGRDVLAPLAVRLLDGMPTEAIGTSVVDAAEGGLEPLPWPEPRRSPTGVEGEIVHVDTFGNLITNLPAALLPLITATGRLRVGRHVVGTVVRTYGDAAPGTPVVLVGSQGLVEVAVVTGRADERLGCGVGAAVSVDATNPESG